MGAVGNTPLVRLSRLPLGSHIAAYGKLESLNPGGSSKDRPALAMILAGMVDGSIGPDTVIIESSSGNMAIGLAQVCSSLGLRLVVVVDARTSRQNVQLLEVYRATVEVVMDPDPASGEFLTARLHRVRELQREIPNSFWTNQYANTANAASHANSTMPEIIAAIDGRLDYLFCATSTCGTLRGCRDYLRSEGMTTTVVAVDAEGSRIFGSTADVPRRLPGMGAAMVPALFDDDLADVTVHVSESECVAGCRELVRQEGLLLGASSGGVVAAMKRLSTEMPRGSVAVGIFADRGERYLETVFSDSWVASTLGAIPAPWDEVVA